MKQPFLLNELVMEVIEEAASIQNTHTITMIPCTSLLVEADREKIGTVISNLLSNAIKYSPENNNVEVKCDTIGNNAQISIKDHAMGIRKGDQEKLFERYYRVESNNSISGFGIGLYLSAEIIQRHSGKIWVESEMGKGSTFYFSLSLK